MAVRCFVALAVPADVIRRIEPAVAELKQAAERAGSRVSWSRPEGWHVTLKFLGEIDEERVARVRSVLGGLAGTARAIELEARGLATLPRRGTPQVLIVSVRGGPALQDLAGRVDDELSRLGFARERRAFVGHLTVGRLRGAGGWRRWEAMVRKAERTSFGSWTATAVGLYRSELGLGPARYSVIEEYRFGGDAAAGTGSAPN